MSGEISGLNGFSDRPCISRIGFGDVRIERGKFATRRRLGMADRKQRTDDTASYKKQGEESFHKTLSHLRVWCKSNTRKVPCGKVRRIGWFAKKYQGRLVAYLFN